MNRTRCLPLAAAALLAGCATPGLPRQALLTDAPAPRERSCWVAPEPARLPDAGDLVDEAAFRADAVRLWTAAGRPEGHVIFSVRHAPDGVQVRRAVIETTVPQALADSLQQLVFAHRRQAQPAREEWGVRVRMDLGEPMALRVGRRETCTPRPREREYRSASNPFDVREGSAANIGSTVLTNPDVVWVHVRLNERGTVTEARVERGLSQPRSEQVLLNFVRTMAFIPATEDGYPVPGELSLPLRLSMVND